MEICDSTQGRVTLFSPQLFCAAGMLIGMTRMSLPCARTGATNG